jgi:hypothetical protein
MHDLPHLQGTLHHLWMRTEATPLPFTEEPDELG